jgi:hypothetical protein
VGLWHIWFRYSGNPCYVELIDRYAKDHSLDLKDVLSVAFRRFFEQEGYLRE